MQMLWQQFQKRSNADALMHILQISSLTPTLSLMEAVLTKNVAMRNPIKQMATALPTSSFQNQTVNSSKIDSVM